MVMDVRKLIVLQKHYLIPSPSMGFFQTIDVAIISVMIVIVTGCLYNMGLGVYVGCWE